MKKRILAVVMFLLACPVLFAQTIPPYGQLQPMPESIPEIRDKKKDLPAKAGSYIVEGAGHFFYQKGKYYESGLDSNLKEYSPWGIEFNPSAEFFLFDMVALGMQASFSYYKLGSDKNLSLGVGPIVSFYYDKKLPFIPFISVFGSYEHTNEYWDSTKSMYWTDQSLSAGGKIGCIFMVTRQGGFFVDGRFTYGTHQVTVPPATDQAKKRGWMAESFIGYKFFVF